MQDRETDGAHANLPSLVEGLGPKRITAAAPLRRRFAGTKSYPRALSVSLQNAQATRRRTAGCKCSTLIASQNGWGAQEPHGFSSADDRCRNRCFHRNRQVKFLRALQECEFRRLGSSRLTPMRARPIFATHQDLEARVAQESFRQNLLYRIDVVRITVPPLRERPEDIPFAG